MAFCNVTDNFTLLPTGVQFCENVKLTLGGGSDCRTTAADMTGAASSGVTSSIAFAATLFAALALVITPVPSVFCPSVVAVT